MLKQRIITGLILAPLVLCFITLTNVLVFSIGVGLLLLLLTHEWIRLIPLKTDLSKAIYYGLTFFAIFAWQNLFTQSHLLFIGAALWAFLYVMIMLYPKAQRLWANAWCVALVGLFLLPNFYHLLINLKQMRQGNYWLLYLLFSAWAADTGAYFIGKFFGKRKLIANVSPNKTVEGLIGGFLAALPVTLIMAYFVHLKHAAFSWGVLYTGLGISAVFGDLFISMLKRRVVIKDVGNLLPGHGGLLDRLDSLLASIFMLGFCQYFIQLQI